MSVLDWKAISKSPGYISLKKAYVHDVQKGWRSKAESRRHFKWVIGRAMHYSIKLRKPIESILNEWEEKRDYWWLNYYQASNQPKLHKKILKPMGKKGIKKHRKQHGF